MEAALVKLRSGGVYKAGEVQLKLLWNIDAKLGELIDLAKGAAETRAGQDPVRDRPLDGMVELKEAAPAPVKRGRPPKEKAGK